MNIQPGKLLLLEQLDKVGRLPRGTFSIGKASKILGVSIDTLRNWEEAGKIAPIRTKGGTRKYRYSQIKKLLIGHPYLFKKQLQMNYSAVNCEVSLWASSSVNHSSRSKLRGILVQE